MHNLFPILHADTESTGGVAPNADSRLDSTLDSPRDSRPNSLPNSRPELRAALRENRHHQSLASELPYLHCGVYQGFGPLHLLADDTLGFAFTLAVPVVDTIPDGEQAVSDTILGMLHALAPGCQWQWFLRSDTLADPALALYEEQPGVDSAGRLFANAFTARWRDAQHRGFFPEDADVNFHPRSQTIGVALKSPPIGLGRANMAGIAAATVPPTWHEKLQAHFAPLRRQSRSAQRCARFIGVVRDVLAAAHAQGWETHPVGAHELVQWAGALLFPQRGGRLAHLLPGVDAPLGGDEIRTAVAALGRIEQLSPAGFCSVSVGLARHHRVVSMLWQPRSVFPGMLNALLALRPNINVCLAASTMPPTAALIQLKARALLNARSTHRFNETEMQARGEALQEVEQRLFADGERIFEVRLQVQVTEESSDDADAAAGMVCKHLESLEMEAAPEPDIGSSLLLRACLPFAVYPRTEQKLRRRRRMLSRDCADLHPGGGCWTGIPPRSGAALSAYPSPIVMYSNALGEPLFIDPTKAEKNPHALVVGQSGSGKSFFVHDYLLHLWRLPDVRLFLISIKADYRKLALLLGRYIEITLDSDISLNPFCGPPSRENQAKWFAALELMLTEGNATQRLSREAEVILQGAALAAAQRNWDADKNCPIQETLLEHVCLELESAAGVLGRQLAAQLHPYRRGPYRRLFNAPRGVQATERFLFFNLGNILRQPCAALASFCVFGLIDETMTDPQLRAVPKGLIADEVWALVRNAHAAAILERSLKAYRSLGGFAVPIVQDPQDLDTPSGRVMLVNTATKIILPMDRSGQDDLQRYVRLNEREMDIVRNLRLVKRRYSEFFVSIDGMRSAKGLLIPDPLRYAIATTDPVDEFQIEKIFEQSKDMLRAVEQFAEQCPYGMPRRNGSRRDAAGASASGLGAGPA
jgi:conjugal transfer ATP-binding protein TraC